MDKSRAPKARSRLSRLQGALASVFLSLVFLSPNLGTSWEYWGQQDRTLASLAIFDWWVVRGGTSSRRGRATWWLRCRQVTTTQLPKLASPGHRRPNNLLSGRRWRRRHDGTKMEAPAVPRHRDVMSRCRGVAVPPSPECYSCCGEIKDVLHSDGGDYRPILGVSRSRIAEFDLLSSRLPGETRDAIQIYRSFRC